MSSPTRVLVAFDKFKDSLTAERACAIAARELRRLRPGWAVDLAPLTDGGDGFCRILTEAAGGEIVTLSSSGPRLDRTQAPIGMVETERLPATVRALLTPDGAKPTARLAVIEMAAVNGLASLPPELRDPWRTTTAGTGQLIRAAAELGAAAVLLGVGGSATSDLGLGALSALGLEFRDAAGTKIRPPFPETWGRIAAVEGGVFPSIPPITIACDVTNPLLGPDGAAAVYGPQKGLQAGDLARHEALARRMAELLCLHCGVEMEAAISAPGAGAAGGITFGLVTACRRARLAEGFPLVSAWLDLDARLAAADIVITGEGRFDASSLAGKGPGQVAARAEALGKRSLVFAGSVTATGGSGSRAELVAITPGGVPLPQALAEAGQNLAAAVGRVFA